MGRRLPLLAPLLLLLPLVASPEDLTSAGAADEFVTIRDLKYQDGVVTGVAENRTQDELRNVKLRIQASWRWKDEKNPGEDTMSWGAIHVIQEVPPGAAQAFRYEHPEPPAARDDGHFHVEVSVAGLSRRRVQPKEQ